MSAPVHRKLRRTPEGNANRAAARRARLDPLVAAMYSDYERGLSLAEVGKKHGGRTIHSVYALFKSRGLPRRHRHAPDVYARGAATRREELDPIVEQMFADYQRPMALAAVGRKYGMDRRSVRENFGRRGLAIRPSPCRAPRRLPNGQIEPYVPLTPAEIDNLIRNAAKLSIPFGLKHEWRKWSLARRGEFIARLRARLQSERDRPELPFSDNVEPFDYASPRAHAIVARMNAGQSSRTAAVKIDICSQGVIWGDRLWFWSRKVGYQSGPWQPGFGRPALHHVMWGEYHGRKVPKSHVLRFVDGNPNNLVPENLTLATRNDVARENQAAALYRKSRAMTAMLLARAQEPTNSHGHTKTLSKLRAR